MVLADVLKKSLNKINRSMNMNKDLLVDGFEMSLTEIKKLPFICEICNTDFLLKEDLRSHVMSVHKKETQCECSKCGKKFSKNYNLARHISNVHEEKKQFQCEKCKAGFAEKRRLNEHIASIHEGKKPYNVSS